MGVIKLDSFDPEEIGIKGLAIQKAVMIVRSLLANELKDTKSVMYELRGNLAVMLVPIQPELTSGSITYANELSVSVTQTIRTGLYNGQDIEDAGIETDTVVRPQWSDLQPNPTTNTQYDRIAASLARTGQENGQSKLHFVCEPFSIEKPISGFSLEVEAAGIHEFTVFQADGKTVAAKKRRSRVTNKQKFAISVSTVGSALGNSQSPLLARLQGNRCSRQTVTSVLFQMMTST
ncbi:hypothetical protein BASA81_016652 [Batrachochytrium salamandrivorans]|nr:hypothetical protein BASA81_016652 [Batrachochytrium salamandrivorans]